MRLRVIISLNVWTKIKSDILKTFQFPKLTNTTHLWEHERYYFIYISINLPTYILYLHSESHTI